MQLERAREIADRVVALLAPHCDRIEIAGSIRRRKAEVGDIEVVAIPRPYDVGLFASGVASVVDGWAKVRGELPCRYTQRMLPEGIALDLFFARACNWGLIYAIRTGSAEYSHRVLACGWSSRGYKSVGGMLTRNGVPVPVREERDLFALAGVQWVDPDARELVACPACGLPATYIRHRDFADGSGLVYMCDNSRCATYRRYFYSPKTHTERMQDHG